MSERKGWHGGVLAALVFHVQRWQAEDYAHADVHAYQGPQVVKHGCVRFADAYGEEFGDGCSGNCAQALHCTFARRVSPRREHG